MALSAPSDAPEAPRLIRGTAIAAMMPMITTTITSSIKLKPPRARASVRSSETFVPVGIAKSIIVTLLLPSQTV